MVACKDCGKEFESRASMEQHHASKHAQSKPVFVPKKKSKRKLVILAAAVLLLVLATYFIFTSGNNEKPTVTYGDVNSINLNEVPKRPIHWHPKLTIIINGVRQDIPKNLGLSNGFEYPVHTHEDVPIIHYENSNPTSKNMILGYFFSTVWKRNFNSTCIFEYCNSSGGNLTMSVNGKPNYQFQNYIPKDGDDIVIRFG